MPFKDSSDGLANNNNDYVEDGQGGEKSVFLTLDELSSAIQVDSEKYFTPLEMACKVNDSPKITILALDSIQV